MVTASLGKRSLWGHYFGKQRICTAREERGTTRVQEYGIFKRCQARKVLGLAGKTHKMTNLSKVTDSGK